MKSIRFFLSENVHILMVKFSIYLKRRVFVMSREKDISIIQLLRYMRLMHDLRLVGSIVNEANLCTACS